MISSETFRPSKKMMEAQSLEKEWLTPREKQIIQLLSDGLTSVKIAKELKVQEKSLVAYIGDIRHSLNAKTTAHAVKIALQKGLIS